MSATTTARQQSTAVNRLGRNGSANDTLPAPSNGTPEGIATPSFEPNAPPSVVPSKDLSLASILYEAGADGARVEDWPLPEDFDGSRPVSILLREGTQRAHTTAENSAGAVALTQGNLPLKEYVRWLGLLWRVYDAMETGLAAHASHPVLAPTYRPELLARAPTLAKDIQYLLTRLPTEEVMVSGNPLKSTVSSPLPPFPIPAFMETVFSTTPAPLAVYLDRLRELASSADTAGGLLSHAYVRYLGDLSGGQIIGARLRKAYDLPTLDGRHFYFFDLDNDTTAAETGDETVGERKKKLNAVKAWYREGMDEGAGSDAALKAQLVKEANLAFVLNTHLFSLINPPPPKRELRYYEKLELKRQEELLRNPPKKLSWAEWITQLVYWLLACCVGLAVAHYGVPAAWKFLEPVYAATLKPTVDGRFVPWWNESIVPWWDHHGWPTLERHMRMQRRRML